MCFGGEGGGVVGDGQEGGGRAVSAARPLSLGTSSISSSSSAGAKFSPFEDISSAHQHQPSHQHRQSHNELHQQHHEPPRAAATVSSSLRLSLDPQPSTTGRASAAGLSKTPLLAAAGSGGGSSVTPAPMSTATPTSNGVFVSPAVTAAVLAGVAPAPQRDAQVKLMVLQTMITQWSFLLARCDV